MDKRNHAPNPQRGVGKTQQVRLRELLFRGNLDTDLSQLQKIFHVLGGWMAGWDVWVGVRTCGCDKGRVDWVVV